MKSVKRFREFVQNLSRLVDETGNDEHRIFVDGKALLTELITHDDWLPGEFAKPDPIRYQQHLLHCDPLERFSVVSFVWGPSQQTPVHDHTVWGMIGMMRGIETCEEFEVDSSTGKLIAGQTHFLEPGDVDFVSPRVGDIHRVSNALNDRASISIHVYGGNIGAVRRHSFDADSGDVHDFVSGYSTSVIPNLWDRLLDWEVLLPETQASSTSTLNAKGESTPPA